MAIGASILRGEIRRHLLMNAGLVAGCVVGATVVTNERGLFVPITIGMSDTSLAFAAMFTQSHLLDHEITNIQMVTPLAPFEVTADSRDLRRRLMDALESKNDPLAPPDPQKDGSVAAFGSAAANVDRGVVLGLSNGGYGKAGSEAPAGGAPGAQAAATAAAAPAANGPTVAASTAPLPTSAVQNNNQPALTVASIANANPAASQANSGVSDGSALTADGGTTLGDSSGTDQTTGPAAVPEPSIWAMLIAGFGMIGFLLRASNRRREDQVDAAV
jgi:hypothetical protein